MVVYHAFHSHFIINYCRGGLSLYVVVLLLAIKSGSNCSFIIGLRNIHAIYNKSQECIIFTTPQLSLLKHTFSN